MPLTSCNTRVSSKWALSKTNTGLNATKHSDTVTSSLTTVATQLFVAQYTILAAGTQVVDLRSFTNPAGEAVTGTQLYTFLLTVTGTGAKAKVEPGASDPIAIFAGTTPSLTVSAKGHITFGSEANPFTISAAAKNILITNTGSATGIITVVAEIGTV
jgi:hypothetical protein